MTAVCGVAGDYTSSLVRGRMTLIVVDAPIPPCPEPATELVRFRCEKGHERERIVCPAHVDILTRPREEQSTFCVVCFETKGIDSKLTPLVAVPDRPRVEPHWIGGAP